MVEALVFCRNQKPRRFHHTGAYLLRRPSSAVVSKENGELFCLESATAFLRRPAVLVRFGSRFPVWRVEYLDNCGLYGGYRSPASSAKHRQQGQTDSSAGPAWDWRVVQLSANS